ncbi:MAG: crossover junction endodeoxyribonuclease RuvC [Acidobacteriota bacterium]|nr:crossover junction endodeoxyribonuclease RuvC [Acidobacteriota bacterium]
MIILGIDPGSRFTGWGILRSSGGNHTLVADGRISISTRDPMPQRLAALGRGVSEIVDRFAPDLAAVESAFYGRNPRSLIVLAQARGAILASLATHELDISEYAPAEVKTAIAGTGRAGKEEVARMVTLLLGLDRTNPKPADTTDAIAVALCCAKRYRMDSLRGAGRA